MSNSDAWTKEWLKAQKKFVESWSSIGKDQGQSDTDNQANLWSNGLEMWRKTYPYPYPNQREADQVFDKCQEVGKGYFTLAEQIGKQIAAGGKPQDVIQQWLEQIKAGLEQQIGHDFMSHWMGPASNWQKMVAAIMPFEMPGSTSGVYGIGEDYDQISQALSMPGLGFFRESQEKQQIGAKLALDYQQANEKFNAAFLQVSIESLQSFQAKMAETSDNETPSSLRALYDLWVDVSETHYADYAMSEEYQSLYGDMVNKLMALKQHYSGLMDETMESLNLPSRKELDTVHQRLQQTRRENRSLRQELREIRALLADKQKKQSNLTLRNPQLKPENQVPKRLPRLKKVSQNHAPGKEYNDEPF